MQSQNSNPSIVPTAVPSFGEAFRFWLKLGFINFGGPAGQISTMHAELVEKRKWIDEARFLHALNYCMLLPGPEATQLAIYIGWLLHRTVGGIIAGLFFVLPSMVFLWALSLVYVLYGKIDWISAIFFGLKAAVMAIVVATVIRIGRKALKNEIMWIMAMAAFIAIFFMKVAFPLILLMAAVIGAIGGKFWKAKFSPTPQGKEVEEAAAAIPEWARPSLGRTLRIAAVGILVWWAPLLLSGMVLGWTSTIFREGLFFSKASVVTFGGAYAVLPYVAQRAVEDYQWLSAHQMLDGLGLAETTPGPLIMVLQFVGFLGAWNSPSVASPFWSATLGALMTTWVTFVPCFLWIFMGAPYIERLRNQRLLGSALSTITAAVVGVILNLAVWFGLHVLFPAASTFDWISLAIALLAFALMQWRQWGVVEIVLLGAVLGLITKYAPHAL